MLHVLVTIIWKQMYVIDRKSIAYPINELLEGDYQPISKQNIDGHRINFTEQK